MRIAWFICATAAFFVVPATAAKELAARWRNCENGLLANTDWSIKYSIH